MLTRIVLGVAIAAAAISVLVQSSRLIGAEESTRIALAGHVSSIEDGPMEGVVVSAKQDGSTVTISVVSDEQGRYSYPSTKVAPGRYAIRIRAVNRPWLVRMFHRAGTSSHDASRTSCPNRISPSCPLPELSTFQPCSFSSEQRKFKFTGSFPMQRTDLASRLITGVFFPAGNEAPRAPDSRL